MDLADLKVSVKMLNRGSIRGRATLTYHGIEIHGFTISDSDWIDKDVGEHVFINPPRQNIKGKWVNTVFIPDEKQWGEIKKIIYDNYHPVMVNSTSSTTVNDLSRPKTPEMAEDDEWDLHGEEIPF